jgi:uncharacterized PurR-regulated membrane protein YhhQ (DUF165 family)
MNQLSSFLKQVWQRDKSWYLAPLIFGIISVNSFLQGLIWIGVICTLIPLGVFVYLFFKYKKIK